MTMNRLKTHLLTAFIMTLIPCWAFAAPNNHSAVRDSRGQIVRGSDANCVRSKSTSDHDPCAVRPLKQTVRANSGIKYAQHKPEIRKANELTKDEKTVFFIFNKSSLTTEAKQRLDTLASTLKADQSVKKANIVGFADRIGSNAYNKSLSQRRAESVRDYLIDHGYSNAQVTETRWVGEEEPSTICESQDKRSQLIECLQDDRRVEVQMIYVHGDQHN